jgi:glutamate-1-semialdehyde aminotransferase
MLNKGVYPFYGGGAILTVHTDEEMNRIIRAAEKAAKAMSAE